MTHATAFRRLVVPVVAAAILAGCGEAPKKKLGDFCTDDPECGSGLCWDRVCLDPDGDEDGDGLKNGVERNLTGTDLARPDTDGDGVPDGEEVGDPAHPADRDLDGQIDALESRLPAADPDRDCLPDELDPENDVPATDDGANPADPCQACDGAAVPPGWTARVDGTPCGTAAACRSGRCVPDMTPVPAGVFRQGCNAGQDARCFGNEHPAHDVDVPAFEIDTVEVTVAAYGACVTDGACTEPLSGATWCNWAREGRDEHPVNCITWDQAVAYCGWAGKRLCTESEWEKAARGTDGRVFPWEGDTGTCEQASMDAGTGFGCGAGGTLPVGSKPAGASPYGVLDLAGNALEWVEDDYHARYEGAPADGTAWIDEPRGAERVRRGGSFTTGDAGLRASFRDFSPPDREAFALGTRCCRSLP